MTIRPLQALPEPALRHGLVEDVFGLLTGTFVASLGIYLLKTAHAVTGGTAGLALLVSYGSGWSFGVLFFLINLPFFALAVKTKGIDFSVRTLLSIALVSGFAYLHPLMLPTTGLNPIYAVGVGNLLAGVGILVVFRHRSSLGGFNVVALLCQERLGWRAGYVQMALDVAVVLAFAVVTHDVALSLASAAGAVLLNLVIAMNHRPGRYTGG